MRTAPLPTFTYPMDAVHAGQVDPRDLNSEQLFGGVDSLSVWDRDIVQTPEGAFHATPDGMWPMPAGLVLNMHPVTEDGSYAEPHTAYVGDDGQVRPLRLDEQGLYPREVSDRMRAEAESRRLVRAMQDPEPQPTVHRMVRVGHSFQELTPTVEMPFTLRDQHKLNAKLGSVTLLSELVRRATDTVAINRAARRAASLLLGSRQPRQTKPGRHRLKMA